MEHQIRRAIQDFEEEHEGCTVGFGGIESKKGLLSRNEYLFGITVDDKKKNQESPPIWRNASAVEKIGDIVRAIPLIMKPHRELNGSYGLKHDVEGNSVYKAIRQRKDKEYTDCYVSNGYFIIAALVYGLPYKKKSVDWQSPNITFCVKTFDSYKSLKRRQSEESDAWQKYEKHRKNDANSVSEKKRFDEIKALMHKPLIRRKHCGQIIYYYNINIS